MGQLKVIRCVDSVLQLEIMPLLTNNLFTAIMKGLSRLYCHAMEMIRPSQHTPEEVSSLLGAEIRDEPCV